MLRWARTTFVSLRHRHFRVVWTGTLLAFLAFFMSTVVQQVVAFELVGSNVAVGFIVFAQGLAMALLGPLGGAVADRWSKRRIVVAAQAIVALDFAALAWLIDSPYLHIVWIAGGSLVLGAAFAFLGPARQALTVALVPDSDRGNAMALIQVANTAARVLGPAIGGFFIAPAGAGPATAYAFMAVAYALSAGVLFAVPDSRPAGINDRPVFADVAAGFRYVARDPTLRLLMGMFVSVIMCGFPYVTVLPGLVENEFGADSSAIALLFVVSAVGSLGAAVGVAGYADSPRAGTIYTGMGCVFGLGLAMMAFAPDLNTCLAAVFCVGVGNGGFQALNGAVLVRRADPAMIGRVMSLTLLAFGGFGLMGLPVGVLADTIGERGTLIALGAVVLALTTGFGLALRRVER